MLSLAEDIDRAHLGVGRIIGNDQRFGRTGEQVDSDAAEQLPLRLGNEHVAGSHQHIDRPDRFSSDRHRSDCLDAAKDEDLIRTGEMHGGDYGRMWRALIGRRGSDDTLHARDFRRQHAHVRGGDHRILPARDVAAYRVDGNMLVAEHNTGQRLDFDVFHRSALKFRESADLRLRELDVFNFAGGKLLDRRFDLRAGQLEGVRAPVVEFAGQLAHGGIAARFDVLQRRFNA